MVEFEVSTGARRELVEITARVGEAVERLGIGDGAILVWVPHTTAAVIVNEHADPDVADDIARALAAMVPPVRFEHAEGNSDAHLLASILGPSVVLPVEHGRLRLGTWQGVFLVELDGPRRRRVWAQSV